MKKKFASLIMFFSFFAFSFANASLYIELNPKYPSPSDTVSAKIQDANVKYITWMLDGKKIASGANEVKFNIDKKRKLTAVLSFENKKTQKIEKIIEPIDLELIFEPETYVLRSLQISPLASFGSKIKVWAILNSDKYKADKLIFNWFKNGEYLKKNSGPGKNYTEIELGIFDDKALISLELFDPNQNKVISKRNLVVLIKKPELLFYSKTLLSWNLSNAVGKEFFVNQSAQLLAVPFSAIAEHIFDPMLTWEWYIGAQKIKEATSPFIEIERQSAQDAKLQASFRNKEKLLQSAEKSVIIRSNGSKQKSMQPVNANEDSAFGI